MAEKKLISLKIKWLYTILLIFTLILLGFCVRWQVLKAQEFKQIAESRVYSADLQSFRGSILAKDGTTLAYSEPRFDLYIWLPSLQFYEDQKIQSREEFVSKIAPLIDRTTEDLDAYIQDNEEHGYLWFEIAKSLTNETRTQINDLTTDNYQSLQLQGIKFLISSKRMYPENQLAAHVVGLANQDKNGVYGVSGIEEAWDGDLSPIEGLIIQESDAVGKAIASALVPTIEPKPGSEIYTGIEKQLQTIVEAKLKEQVEMYKAVSGTVIIMDPKTGEIMALANYPTYNPNLREAENPNAYSNIAIYDPIEIGSIMKTVTLSAALDSGVLKPDTIVQPEGHQGCLFVSDELPGDGSVCTWDKKPQPPMTATECFIRSDNLCFIEIGKLVGEETFYEYLVKFGVGLPSGIDLKGESSYPLKHYTEWDIADEVAFTYGHGYLVNMVQVISAVSVIPNKGTRMLPHIVTKVIKGDGEEKIMHPTPIKNIISLETANLMSDIMQQTYQNNVVESYYESLKRYPIGWKTGSALIADPNNPTCPYCNGDLNNTIVGFDASEDAKFIMLVKLEKPTGGLSFYNVRPAWLEIFNAVKDELGMEPVY